MYFGLEIELPKIFQKDLRASIDLIFESLILYNCMDCYPVNTLFRKGNKAKTKRNQKNQKQKQNTDSLQIATLKRTKRKIKFGTR